MKVILLEDVKGQGKKGEMKEVSIGYARDALIPGVIGMKAFHLAESKKQALATKDLLADKTIVFKTTGGADGRLYSAVTAKDISAKIKSDIGIDIDKRDIIINENIKLAGEYTVKVKLFQGISADLKLIVEA